MSQTPAEHPPAGLAVLNAVHDRLVFDRRAKVIAENLANIIPSGGRVLDFGCGDGAIAWRLMQSRPDLAVEGVDVLVRPKTHIPVRKFDGGRLPFEDKSFDYVTIVDVMHHTDNPAAVLTEAARVARMGVVVKDHVLKGIAAEPVLRFMDYVGNRGHGVRLPYNYLSEAGWAAAFARAGCTVLRRIDRLGLYAAPFSLVFERDLHFMALLAPDAPGLA